MPLPRWLNSLIGRKPPKTSAPPPPRGEGWGGGPDPAIASEVQPFPTPDPTPRGEGESHPAPDQSHRIHIAANDPAFPAKREAAVKLICQAITDVATPMGYTRKGTTWARTTKRGKSAIHLQRSSYGFVAYINLRFVTPDGNSLNSGVWAQDDDIRIQRFYLPTESIGLEDGVLTYLDVSETPDCLIEPMHILASRALPWLDAHHETLIPPKIERYLPR